VDPTDGRWIMSDGIENGSGEYLVEGMTCAHCVASVTEEVSEVAGVGAVTVQLNVGGASVVTVERSGAASVSGDAVRAAVEEAGYRVVQG
jgi:copper chaperone